MHDRSTEFAHNAEQALRFQKMYAAVILACLDEAIEENTVAHERTLKDHAKIKQDALEAEFLAMMPKDASMYLTAGDDGSRRGSMKSSEELIRLIWEECGVDFLASFVETPIPDSPLTGTEDFIRWANSEYGDRSFEYACIYKNPQKLASMEEFINNGVRTSSLMGRIAKAAEAEAAAEAELEDA